MIVAHIRHGLMSEAATVRQLLKDQLVPTATNQPDSKSHTRTKDAAGGPSAKSSKKQKK